MYDVYVSIQVKSIQARTKKGWIISLITTFFSEQHL